MFKALGNAVIIGTLDSLVSNAVNRFDDKVANFDFTRLQPDETVAILEEKWFADCHTYYNDKSFDATGKKVPDNWKEDKELVSVRKRMLKRELESRRGNLQKQCELTSKVRAALIETVLSDVGAVHDAFMNKLQLPMNRAELRDLFAVHEARLRSTIAATYPDGLEGLDRDSQTIMGCHKATIFLKSVDLEKQKKVAKNEEKIRKVQERLQQDAMKSIQSDLKIAFEEIVQKHWEQVSSSLYFMDDCDKPRCQEKLRTMALSYLNTGAVPMPPTAPASLPMHGLRL